MTSIKKGLVAIATEVLEDIKKEAEKIIYDAEKKAEENLKKAKEEAEKARDRLLGEAKKKSEIEKKKTESLTEVKMNSRLLQVKEELVSTVFDKALDHLKKFVKTESYHSYLLTFIQEAVEKIDSDTLVVFVNTKDRKWLARGNIDKLSKKLGVKFILAEEAENCLGGCVAKTPDGKISYDNTFEKRLQQLRPILRIKVAKALFEKKD